MIKGEECLTNKNGTKLNRISCDFLHVLSKKWMRDTEKLCVGDGVSLQEGGQGVSGWMEGRLMVYFVVTQRR